MGVCKMIFKWCMCVLVAQSYRTLCDPMDYNPPGSSVHGILQARILEWVAISFSKREAVAEGQYVRFHEGVVPCNQALTLQEVFYESGGSGVIMKGFPVFLEKEMQRLEL